MGDKKKRPHSDRADFGPGSGKNISQVRVYIFFSNGNPEIHQDLVFLNLTPFYAPRLFRSRVGGLVDPAHLCIY